MQESTNQIALEIAHQIGARGLKMLGAKQLVAGYRELIISVGKNDKRVSKIRVSLNMADLYNVTFFNIRGIEIKEIAHIEDVHVEELHQVIEQNTGMYLSL